MHHLPRRRPSWRSELCLETVPNCGRTGCCSLVPILIRALYHLAPNLFKIKTFQMAEGECSRCVFRQEDVDFKNELIQLLSWHLMRQCFMTGALSRVGWIRTLQSEWHCCASMCLEPWMILPWLYLGERGDCHIITNLCLIFQLTKRQVREAAHSFNCMSHNCRNSIFQAVSRCRFPAHCLLNLVCLWLKFY